jgi:thiamine-monophosphate kinase
LRDLASAAIDISDGLLADLGHICQRSGVGAMLNLPEIPLSDPVKKHIQQTQKWSLPLSAGDDYELCLIVPAENQAELEERVPGLDVRISLVGQIESSSGIRCLDDTGAPIDTQSGGYDHFRDR